MAEHRHLVTVNPDGTSSHHQATTHDDGTVSIYRDGIKQEPENMPTFITNGVESDTPPQGFGQKVQLDPQTKTAVLNYIMENQDDPNYQAFINGEKLSAPAPQAAPAPQPVPSKPLEIIREPAASAPGPDMVSIYHDPNATASDAEATPEVKPLDPSRTYFNTLPDGTVVLARGDGSQVAQYRQTPEGLQMLKDPREKPTAPAAPQEEREFDVKVVNTDNGPQFAAVPVAQYAEADEFLKMLGDANRAIVHEIEAHGRKWLIKELSFRESTKLLTEKYRGTAGGIDPDSASRLDHMTVLLLHHCIVKEDGAPFFSKSQAATMYTSNNGKFRTVANDLAGYAIQHNPHLIAVVDDEQGNANTP